VIQSNENLKDPDAQEQLVSRLLSMPMPIGGTSQRQILGPVHEPEALLGKQAEVTERELEFHPLYDKEAKKITLVSSEGIAFRVEKAILSKHRYV
jgi:hypothetical protein